MTNNDELERRKFEAWLNENIREHLEILHLPALERRRIEQVGWRAWKASRESIEIELPEYADAEDKAEMLEMCRQSVHYAGLKVKGES
ncbi:hypothetical protein O3W44_01570 [Pantoea sp. LMR881]|uniref:hypothetical protein n=1 Tax=Pantoea sp. LMR881 TaxID=3014336 RepID=UPI0022AFA92F|nr:hypothetical protein [Pantoea sp. LMR881]MCZ4057814.1 hypothetical protein [Pantoea sp. LMR881]MCZ4058058.1 hypothetical protein [Pantoea sp. LMR881]